MICPKCKKTIKDNSKVCGYCGKKLATTLLVPVKKEQPVPKSEQSPNIAKCPMCGSISLQATQRGYDDAVASRAIGIGLLFGGVAGALTAASLGSQTVIKCLNCGYTFSK